MAKIMLVDDAAFMRMMLKTTLTQAGYTDLVEAEDNKSKDISTKLISIEEKLCKDLSKYL